MKVYATIANVSRESDTSPAVFKLDYMFLKGAKRSDSVGLIPQAYGNELVLIFKLKQLLAAHLNATYAPLTFTPLDVLIAG
jgi:hypothetical protein